LSKAEYQSIVREYTLLKPLRSAGDAGSATQTARKACGTSASPNTRLMVLVRRDCLNALEFFTGITAVEQSPSEAGVYERLEGTIRRTVGNAQQINAELARRGIRGLCARSAGI